MANITSRNFRNNVLSGLSDAQLAILEPHLEPVELRTKMTLERPGELIEQVYFPDSGVASVATIGPGNQRIEVGLFGREGMSGLAVLLGDDHSLDEIFMQVAGTGQRIKADALREAIRWDFGLRSRILLCVQVFAVQFSHMVFTGRRYTLKERLAHWLLMCHDRVDGDRLEITHEFLALTLGVQRSHVTLALHRLERRGVIKTSQRRVYVLDRVGLEAESDGLYGLPEAEYARLMGESPV